MSLGIEEAQARITGALSKLPQEIVPLDQALGRVLFEALHARRALPLFESSAMDGYAVRAADTGAAPVTLRLVAEVPAGHPTERELGAGEAARIFTGAPLPKGADGVVMQEDVEADGETVRLPKPVAAGKHVRRAGEDMQHGDLLAAAGTVLGPGELGAIASQGILSLGVTARPTVAIVPTGDELVALDREPGPGQVPNSNALMLAAQARTAGAVPKLYPPAPDDPRRLSQALEAAARDADLVITCGGVSVGDFDFVRQVLGTDGRVDFYQVAMKPGRPLAFGQLGKTPLLGLPGNPVSAFVCFELFARPALNKLAGTSPELSRRRVRLHGACSPDKKRRELIRARLRPEGTAEPLPRQGSHHLSSLLGADLLLDIPPGEHPLPPGSELDAWVLPRALATAPST